jgi:5-methyltetrahydrofolate--homocysteine methyltransferase
MINGLDLSGKVRVASSILMKALKLRSFSLLDLIERPLPSIFDLTVPVDEVLDAYTRLLSVIRCYGDCWPRWWVNFGPGIVSGFLGGAVHPKSSTVWFDHDPPIDLESWRASYDAENPWRLRVEAITKTAVARWGSEVNVGLTDLGCNLDILASLRGTEQLLIDTIENPEAVERQSRAITGQWLRYYKELYPITRLNGRGCTPWAHIWAPSSCYMLQCDFSYMISPGMFERFVMPDLETCCAELDFAFYHLDGKGEIPHLDQLLSIDRLRGIQWIPGDGQPPPEEWLELLSRIRQGGKLVQLYVSAKGALKIIREFGGKGFAMYIMDRMSATEAKDYLKQVEEAGRSFIARRGN